MGASRFDVATHVGTDRGTAPRDVVPNDSRVEHLSAAECWRLLQEKSFGRLAVAGLDGIPDVFPLNYTVHEECIYIRTAPGSKLMDIARRPVAAFEIDGDDDSSQWSVVVRGSARRLDVDAQIHASGVLAVVSASPTSKHNVIRVTPTSVSGRRFKKRVGGSAHEPVRPILRAPANPHEPVRPIDGASMWPQFARQGSEWSALPIPSFPPRSTV